MSDLVKIKSDEKLIFQQLLLNEGDSMTIDIQLSDGELVFSVGSPLTNFFKLEKPLIIEKA